MKLIYLSLSWISGIYLGTVAGFHWGVIATICAVALTSLTLSRRQALLLVLCLAIIAGGILRFQSTTVTVDESVLRYYNGESTVRVEGLVAADPEVTGSTVALRVEVAGIDAGDGWREVSGVALLYLHRFLPPDFPEEEARNEPPYYRYGDLLRVEGKLETPAELEEFDWGEYLARQGIYSVISYPAHVELAATGQGFKPQEWLYAVRNRLAESLEGALHEPQASLAQAVLLGKRGAVPGALRESLSRTGTAHILAVSGLHIGIAGGMALSFWVWLLGRRRGWYFWLALGAIWGFALLTGLHAPALRAAIMVSLWLTADYVGRPRSALTSLLFAAALMTGIHPSVLGEVSFQMSFAAMGGLVLLTPHFQSWGRRIFGVAGSERGFRGFFVDSLSVTLGAVLATLPVIVYYFQQISLVALPANFLALPALPFAIGGAAVVAVVGVFAMPLAQVLGWGAWLCFCYMIEVTEFFAYPSFASVEIDVGATFVWGYYAVLGMLLWLGTSRTSPGDIIGRMKGRLLRVPELLGKVPAKLIIVPLVIVAALVWTAAATAPDNRLHVFFFDVGQGDAILIQKGHQQVLVDGGPDGEKICLELGDKLPFWDRTIELVIPTHPNADHIAGLVEVVKRYGVGQILTSGQESESLLYGEWRRLIEEKGIERTIASAGQRVELADDMVMEVLHPQERPMRDSSSDMNNNSVVLRLVYGDFSLLLTGDIFVEAEQYLLDGRFPLDSTVLKVAHHGSDSSSGDEFITEVGPQIAVISVGADNAFGHPVSCVVERLSDVVGDEGLYLVRGARVVIIGYTNTGKSGL